MLLRWKNTPCRLIFNVIVTPVWKLLSYEYWLSHVFHDFFVVPTVQKDKSQRREGKYCRRVKTLSIFGSVRGYFSLSEHSERVRVDTRVFYVLLLDRAQTLRRIKRFSARTNRETFAKEPHAFTSVYERSKTKAD